MDPTSLELLKRECNIDFFNRGISLTTLPSWTIIGENRLSYTTIIRLVECCREYHWEKDILTLIGKDKIDSITKNVSCNFITPIMVEAKISIFYKIIEVRSRGYSIKFSVLQESNDHNNALVSMVCVFFDPVTDQKYKPSNNIITNLKKLV